MANEPTNMHTAGTAAPTVTGVVARCAVCGCQWQVRGDPDKMGCKFCDAPEDAISLVSEAPGYEGYVVLH